MSAEILTIGIFFSIKDEGGRSRMESHFFNHLRQLERVGVFIFGVVLVSVTPKMRVYFIENSVAGDKTMKLVKA
jgi:hypothetical protein